MPIKTPRPKGEDPTDGNKAVAQSATAGSFKAPGYPPPGEDHTTPGSPPAPTYQEGPGAEAQVAGITGPDEAALAAGEIENAAEKAGHPEEPEKKKPVVDFLALVREAEDQALLYQSQTNRKSWSISFRAIHNEHFAESKYRRPEWRNRSKMFVPKTRSAMRKDLAAVAASMFNNVDSISCMPGNDGDPQQRAAAAIMQELVNYRTSRTSSKASFPWFLLCMGARQNAWLTGFCLSKQSWKLDYRLESAEEVKDEETGEARQRETYTIELNRPNMDVIPPENVIIDPAADWTNPAQSAAFLLIRWPMRMDEIRRKQNDPFKPWNDVSEDVLLNATESGKFDAAAMRRAREGGIDRMDEQTTGTREFKVIWVYECYIRTQEEDWTFLSVGDQAYLTDPEPVREVYPEQNGERPLAWGYGSLEAHRIYPMSPAEQVQPLQAEVNDLRNLGLDALKQNVLPVTKVRRGGQVDLDQVRRRAHGSSIMVNKPDDVTWDRPPDIPQSFPVMNNYINTEFDDLAGQYNAGTVQSSNALERTLGGLKLAAGSANAVQEFDIRLWVTTWAETALAQIVRLEQYYEDDPIVLGLVGQKAKLFQKHGINEITDELLEQEVTVSVSVGLGAGDPMQRIQKFSTAAQIVAPLLAQSPDFQSGKREVNTEGVIEEVFGAAGYKDAGDRFFKDGEGRPNPMGDLPQQALAAKIQKDIQTGKSSLMQGLAALAKVSLGNKELEADMANTLIDAHFRAKEMGTAHAHDMHDRVLSARDHGHRHGLEIRQHHTDAAHQDRTHEAEQFHRTADRAAQKEQSERAASAKEAAGSGGEGGKSKPTPKPAPKPAPEQSGGDAGGPDMAQLAQQRRPVRYEFTHDKGTGRISGAVPIYADQDNQQRPAAPQPQSNAVPMPPPGAI